MNKKIAKSMLQDSISELLGALDYLEESENKSKLQHIANQYEEVLNDMRKEEIDKMKKLIEEASK